MNNQPHSFVLVCALVMVGCSRPTAQTETPVHHPSLLVVEGGTDVRFLNDYDGAVKYLLRAPYPADEVIETIKKRLGEQGWMPRNHDLLNPGLENSHLRGWGDYIDRNDDLIHMWGADWTNQDGDDVGYRFSYRLPPDSNGVFVPNDKLEVIAIYMSAKTVKGLLNSRGLSPRP